MQFLFIVPLLALAGCATMYTLPSPPPTSQVQFETCKDGIGPGDVESILDDTYKITMSEDYTDYQISASYSNGLYQCTYQFSRDYISSDTDTTYFHHAIETVSVSRSSDAMDSNATITSPLRIISDTITNQMPTRVYRKKQQDAYNQAKKIIQDQINYNKAHPCKLWRTQDNVTSCVIRQGDLY
ncbi:MAG TPA: hypothetical protein PLO16_13605 [Acidocella sp.]|nr:hypothetical protein [Acidocella sp.]